MSYLAKHALATLRALSNIKKVYRNQIDCYERIATKEKGIGVGPAGEAPCGQRVHESEVGDLFL